MSWLLVRTANASVREHQVIRVVINGKPEELPDGTTVAGLIARLGVTATRVAVERNHDVVPRKAYDEVTLQTGDRLEVVAFVGGG